MEIGKNTAHAHGSLIKEALLRQLSCSIKEVQLQYSQTNEIFSTNEACNNLIVVLEAIFLHGLKKGILQAALRTAGGTQEKKPQPSFWSAISKYTHKNTIQSIKKLNQINTDVGRCRVWLRIALNQAELPSYFRAIDKEVRVVNSSYHSYAFLRDRETCDTATKLLEGIIAVNFDIPVNANILNNWNTEPLSLSGIWSPTMKIPVSNAADVVEGIEVDVDDDDTSSVKTSSSVTALSTILALDENQALKIILDTPLKKLEEPTSDVVITKKNINDENENKPGIETSNISLGNCIVNTAGWSSSGADPPKVEEVTSKMNEQNEKKIAIKNEEPNTFSGLLEIYGNSPKEETNYKAILSQYSARMANDEGEGNSDFEVFNKQSDKYENILFKIIREKGLKAQKYSCHNCQLSIGLNFEEARYCFFTGKYFCNKCHLNGSKTIPSRLLYNWDHKKYPVCAEVNSYLSEISSAFSIDVKKINPKLYAVIPEMQELRSLRFRLNLLRAYLYTCREPVILELQKKVWPRDYLYENIHVYTLNDLCKVPGGNLANELKGVIAFARDHVLSCWLCSQKGFICEICRNPKVIYPFDYGCTYRCSKCYAVYHEDCLASSKNCPKCKRMRERNIPCILHSDSD